MAKKNDLEVSPAQEAEAGRQVRARVEYPSNTNGTDRDDTGENGKVLRRAEDDDAQHKGTTDAGSRHDELDSDDAEDLAGLINDASLSGTNIPGTKPVDKTSEGTFRRTYTFMTTLFTGGSQKPTESNNNLTSQSVTSQNRAKAPQVPHQETSDNSAVSNGDKAIPGKSLARPKAIYEDISNMHKPRRSGLPDLYVVPQSPPRSPAPEPKPNAPKRRGPKPSRVLTREKPEQVAMTIEEAPISAEEELAERQKHVEHADKALGCATRAISAGEEWTARSKRATRSTRTNDFDDLEEFQRQRERYQRKIMKGPRESRESREFLQFSSPTQSGLAVNKGQFGDQGSGNQAGTSVAEPEEPQDDLQSISRTKPQPKSKGPAVGRRETQYAENIPVTPAKRHDEVEKGSAQDNAQPELHGISPILSGPTPAKGIQESPKRLQRPSLVPKATQGRKPNASSQQVAKGYPVRSPVSSRMPRGAQGEDSDDEDNFQHESDLSRAPTPSVIKSRPNRDGATSFISEETLEQLRSTIKKAGQNSKDERVIEDDDYWTAIGRILSRGVKRLISKYKAMDDLISAGVLDDTKFHFEHQKALKFIEIIREKTQAVLTNRLGDPKLGERNADPMSRSHMLEDLYLYVIPDLVEALYRAVKSRQDRETLEISDMEEFYALLKILYDLVKVSRGEDKAVQPKAPRTNQYKISQPTQSLWPTLRKLYEHCGRQLFARKVARRAEKLRQTMPDRAKKRKERLEAEERAEEEQFQQRLRERNKAIIASLNERRAELGLPPCSQLIEPQSMSQYPHTTEYREEDPVDDVDHDMNRRLIGVFGRNNSHPETTPKEWTKAEMEILVDGLRRERGTYMFCGDVKQCWC
jgi:hypothetical protein